MATLKAIRGGRGIQRGLTLLKTCAGSARPRGPTITSEEVVWAFDCCHPNPAGGGEKTDTQSDRPAGQRYCSPTGWCAEQAGAVKKRGRWDAAAETGERDPNPRWQSSLQALRRDRAIADDDQIAVTADQKLQPMGSIRSPFGDRAGLDRAQVRHQHHGGGANAKTNRQGAGLPHEHGHDRTETDRHHDLEESRSANPVIRSQLAPPPLRRYQTTGVTEPAMTQMGQNTTSPACGPAGVETSPGLALSSLVTAARLPADGGSSRPTC